MDVYATRYVNDFQLEKRKMDLLHQYIHTLAFKWSLIKCGQVKIFFVFFCFHLFCFRFKLKNEFIFSYYQPCHTYDQHINSSSLFYFRCFAFVVLVKILYNGSTSFTVCFNTSTLKILPG